MFVQDYLIFGVALYPIKGHRENELENFPKLAMS